MYIVNGLALLLLLLLLLCCCCLVTGHFSLVSLEPAVIPTAQVSIIIIIIIIIIPRIRVLEILIMPSSSEGILRVS
jgi:hypothetical protein